ncbi:hypothetical protein [Streptomyces sp. NPDC004266]|uniref:hypothetical protein n=1 Tax=Streptomyces sp. NPDC004266 TaxID=3364693 RepID=UPI0036AE33F6
MRREIEDEAFRCPPALLLIGRPRDGRSAAWSRAGAAIALSVGSMGSAAALDSLPRATPDRPLRPAARADGSRHTAGAAGAPDPVRATRAAHEP